MLSVEFDYASGDSPGADYQRFDTLFGMRRADLAPSGIYNAIGRANLQSLGVRLEATPSARLEVMGTYRVLWAADRTDSFSTTGIRDASGAAGRHRGPAAGWPRSLLDIAATIARRSEWCVAEAW